MPWADGPYEIIEQINDNAYKVDWLDDYGVSATFKVVDLSPYLDDDYLKNLSANSSSQGESDGGPSYWLPMAQISPKAIGRSQHFKPKKITQAAATTVHPYCIPV